MDQQLLEQHIVDLALSPLRHFQRIRLAGAVAHGVRNLRLAIRKANLQAYSTKTPTPPTSPSASAGRF